jgi:diacylglycerol kinase family enzyme
VLSFGVGGLTDKIVNESGKWMGGRTAFLVGALKAMTIYRAAPVAVSIDGQTVFEGRMANVALANGRYFGGGMKIAPNADPSDGQLEVVVIDDIGVLGSLALAPSLYAGKHVNRSDVSVFRGATVSARVLRADEPVLIDLDGEAPGRLPLEVRMAAGAIRMRI